MAELVYAHALGACGETLRGSSPLPPILLRRINLRNRMLYKAKHVKYLAK